MELFFHLLFLFIGLAIGGIAVFYAMRSQVQAATERFASAEQQKQQEGDILRQQVHDQQETFRQQIQTLQESQQQQMREQREAVQQQFRTQQEAQQQQV